MGTGFPEVPFLMGNVLVDSTGPRGTPSAGSAIRHVSEGVSGEVNLRVRMLSSADGPPVRWASPDQLPA